MNISSSVGLMHLYAFFCLAASQEPDPNSKPWGLNEGSNYLTDPTSSDHSDWSVWNRQLYLLIRATTPNYL